MGECIKGERMFYKVHQRSEVPEFPELRGSLHIARGVWTKVILKESISEKLRRFRNSRSWSGGLGIGDFMTLPPL